MGDLRPQTPGAERLLAVIELQNAIAAAAMNADDVMRVIAERAASMTAAGGALVAVTEGAELVCRAATGAGVPAVGDRVPAAGTLAGRCLVDGKPAHADAELCVPLLYGEHAVGVLATIAPRAGAFTAEDLGTLPLLAQIIAIALHRAYTYPRPRYDSTHDPVTGLANRRAFDERIEAELGRNKRYGHSFSLAVIRLVDLETAIDRIGQPAGDALVREVAAILTQHTRAIDACFRLAANELAIVMPGTSREGAQVLAGRFRTQINDGRLRDSRVSASFGVVEAGDETPAALTARANDALDRTR